MPALRHDAGPGPAAAALHLAALDGQIDRVAARIAADDLDLGAEQRVHHARELLAVGARPVAADDEFGVTQLIEGFDGGGVPRDAGADLVVGAADPVVPGRIETGAALGPDQ